MDRKGSRKNAPASTTAPVQPVSPPPAPRPPPPAARVAPPPPRPAFPFSAFPAKPPASRGFFPPAVQARSPGPEEVEHRRFPRAGLVTPFALWIDEAGARRFTATLRSVNVSVGGAFLESTFFLPLDTELRVRFSLAPDSPAVEARARVVREHRPRGDTLPSGFGIHFEEFYNQTEVALARLFLDARLRAFAQEYLASPRARGLPDGLERVVDALAAWELLKAQTSADTWRDG